MSVPKFDPKELTVVGEIQPPVPLNAAPVPVFNFPITPKEAVISLFNREPVWQITGVERLMFSPKVNPDNVARAFIYDGTKTTADQGGGKDMFGIEWEYVAEVGGSMVRPGKPFMEDANEWAEKIVWPDIDSWNWEESAKANKEYLATDRYVICWFLNGWYERLIAFMDFEGAIMAVFDEDQKDAVKDFFEKLTDLYIRIFDKYLTYFPQIDGFCIHDDWGSQKETFFSPAVVQEMIVPYMKKVTDFLHSKGKHCELHSCGQILKQVPNMIDAGWDAWCPQAMNDTQKIYELYGDKLIIGLMPELYDPAQKSEEEQRAAAREYADKFCDPKKPTYFNSYGAAVLTREYREELYKRSRENYSK